MNSMDETKRLAPWTEVLPPDWEVSRIDAVADVLFSNVDKHTLLDHIIFNRSGYFSFLEAGRL
jgi:hypothetical protein